MLHLALTTNLLTAIGAAPHLHRPNFPILSRWYPPGVQIALVPFGERALRHFIYLERPEGMDLADAEGFAAVGRAQPLTGSDELMAAPEDYQTVGHLYRGIEHGLERLVERYGEAGVFIGSPEAQATTEVFEWPELTAVTDLASARAAIELIVEQGEGARGDWRNAHLGRFIALLDEYLAARAADPSFEPARPVEPAYLRRPPDVATEVAAIGDPLTAQVADLFNAVYETTLQSLSRYFVHSGETAEQVATLARTAKHLMNWGDAAAWQHPHQLAAGVGAPRGPGRAGLRDHAALLLRAAPPPGGLADPGRAAAGAGRPGRAAQRERRAGTAERAGRQAARHGPRHPDGLAQWPVRREGR
jgi:hypothetical protein